MTLEQFNKKIDKKFPQNHLQVIYYTTMKEPTLIKCLDCNTEFYFEHAENALRRKYGCKKCLDSVEWALQKQTFIKWLKKHPEFELIDDLNKIHNSQAHIKCKCTNCGRVQTNKTIYNYYDGKSCYCRNKGILKPNDILEKDFKDICIFLEKYKNTDTPILVENKKCHHQFKVRPADILSNPFYCPICNSSTGEKRILYWLEENKIEYYRQYSIINNYKIDFYLPQYNLFIEYNGIQHYKPVKHFGGENKFIQQQIRDQKVRAYCQSNNINLLEINYKQFNNIEQILERKLGCRCEKLQRGD